MTGIFCPRCKGDMTKRHSARGPFWGCKAFPTCRGTLNVTADGGSDGTTAGIDPTEFPLDAKPVDPATVPARIIALDDEQLLVAAWRSGEAVAAAAAGSGKSTVLVERTADLVREGELPENVLTLTFSRDAASSLRDKLAKRLGSDVAARCRAATYHAFCLALLKRWYPTDARLGRIVGASDEAPSKLTLFGQALRETNAPGDADAYAEIDERLREAGIDLDAEDAVEQVEKSRWGGEAAARIVTVSRRYSVLKHERECCDFSDMLCVVAKIFAKDPKRILRYAHVQVDEAQDTNVVQQQIAMALGGCATSLIWVGDLRQSIYGWRGAEPTLLTDRVAAGAQLLPIRTNYRSTVAIVEAGNAIARGHDWHLGGDCRARPDAPDGERPVVRSGGAADAAAWISADLADDSDGQGPSSFALLARTNSILVDAECALVARGLPVRVLGSKGGVWETQVGRLVRAYLHAADNEASPDFVRIGNRPLRYAKSDALKRAAGNTDITVVEALRSTGDRGCIRLAGDLEDLEDMSYEGRCDQVCKWLVRDVADRAAGLKQEPDEDRIETIRALCDAAVQAGSITAIEEQVSRIKKTKDDQPAVTLSTGHRAKGLEWAHVYVLGTDAALFPHMKATDVEEERRLFYVATTRAALSLTYLVSDGEGRSPFIDEMGDAVKVVIEAGAP